MEERRASKVMTTKEAVSRFVHDGDSVITGNYTESLPMSLIFEIIRQGKKDLTYYSQSGTYDAEFMITGGGVVRMVSAFLTKHGGRKNGGSMVERYQRAGKIEVEDYTNFTYSARLAAGAYGYSYMPVLPSIMDTDVFRVRGFMGEKKFGVTTCPFTGRKIPVVPAANPDVCLLHVHRADKFGNAQHWGGLGSTVHACLASKRIIVTCEEIVDHDIIKSSPHLTIVPAFRVCAVIEEPYGCHPADIPGYRNRDMAMVSMFLKSYAHEDGLRTIFDEWVYGLPDRAAYMDHYVKVFGQASLDRIRAKSYYSAPANYGIAFDSGWDPNGLAWELGVDMEGLERLIEEKGEIVDVD
ncbi:MAG: Glutaconate CoA-transferase subunit A [Syntrophaceae bacterium PtaU1.Bin231]|nr:MAG: Glutaconate CoA-transferase subunit A [Syntrophaceae bacterium PtaU1.Bin231]